MSYLDKIQYGGTTYDLGKPVDATLAVSGSPADAKVVGDKLDAITESIFDSETVEPVWEQGTYNNIGNKNPAEQYIRTDDKISVGDGLSISVASGYTVRVSYYNSDRSYKGRENAFSSNTREITGESFITIVLAKSDRTNASPEDGENVSISRYISAYAKSDEIQELSESVETIMEKSGNLYDGDEDITFTTSYTYYFPDPLPAGTYTLGVTVTTDDTDATNNRFNINMSGTPSTYTCSIARNERAYYTFTAGSSIKSITFFAATTTTISTGKTATWAGITLESGTSKHDEYIPPIISAIDYVARSNIGGVSTAYVETTGSDSTGDGTSSNPYATVNKALAKGATNILVAAGVYEQNIDLSLVSGKELYLCKSTPNGKVIFLSPTSLIASSETKVSGYENVYSVSCEKTFADRNIWIFQDGIPDTTTLISAVERHPLQRGYEYRCHDTKIEKTSATTLSDALTEIESSDDYKWFYDSSNQVLYFSRPASVTSDNPIRGSFADSFFANTAVNKAVTAVGIDVKYMRLNVNSLCSAFVKNCKVSNVFHDGCYTYGGCIDAKFISCEAERAFTGTNGDGFNAHGNNTGNPWAKMTHGVLINCWSHDNRDDGFSDHERCESLIIGGLYEYNRYGGGVSPSTGSHAECHDVYARKNGEAGIVYMNDTPVAEGGVGGQVICYNCVAENNTIWENKTQAGFKMTGNGNTGIFINCKSIGQDNGFWINNGASSTAILIDCGVLNCTTAKGGGGTYVVKNTELVE